MKHVPLRLVRPAPPRDAVPPELAPFVEVLAEMLAADHLRQQQKPYRVRLLPAHLRGLR